MKIKHGILGAIALAASTAVPAAMDLGCVRLDLAHSGVVCSGALAPVSVTIDNACPETKRVAVTFALGREPLRADGASIVPGEHRLRRPVMVEIPETIAPGTHALTVTARDIEGNSNAMNVTVIVDRCAFVALVKK